MLYRLYIFILVVLINTAGAYGQIAGEQAFDFLNIPHTARLTGLGGVNVSTYNKDVNLIYANPASVSDSMSGYLSINYLNYFADAGLSSFAYAHHTKKYGTFTVGAQRMTLGDFQGFDASGNATRAFNSGSTSILLGHSRMVNNFRVGVNMKVAISNVANYRSSAMLFDIGGMFVHPSKELTVGLVLKNIGFVLSEFTDTSDSSLPLDVQLGATFKPEHMPFRFSFTALSFANLDIAYNDPNDGISTDDPGAIDKMLMHFVVGTELLLGKNVNIRAGYNHKIRKELRLQEAAGGAGFSFGFMVKVKSFEIAYGHGGYHLAGGTNNFTIATHIGSMITKKTN